MTTPFGESATREATPYDRVAYPGFPYANTRPDHLATLGHLNGMTPMPPGRCRVLEIGCGDGGNIIPMAEQLPQSEFIGIDLSEQAVVRGRKAIGEIGLKNVALFNRDIMDVSAQDGTFDYIIAHGVYSWVPSPVRDKILSVFKENLSSQGIAYVSYNAFPGGHLRNLVRSMQLFHVRSVSDPQTRVAQARMLLKGLVDATPESELYGIIMRHQLDRVEKVPDHVLLHDDLDLESTAFFLHEVLQAAALHGLQFLADADVPSGWMTEGAKKIIAGIPEEDVASREQYLDFIYGRSFHQNLLCHHDVVLRRPVTAARVQECYVASGAKPVSEFDPKQPGPVEFRFHRGTLKTDHRLGKAALLLLGKSSPQALAFAALVEQGSTLSGGPAAASEVEALADILFRAFLAGQVGLHRAPLPLTTLVDERPLVSRYARWQARRHRLVTSLDHTVIDFDDMLTRRLLVLADGSRTIDELARDLKAGAADSLVAWDGLDAHDSNGTQKEITPKIIWGNLQRLARLGLLGIPATDHASAPDGADATNLPAG